MKQLARLSIIVGFALVFSCKSKDDVTPIVPETPTGLDALPEDTGGTHTPRPLGMDGSPYGYYIYTPSAYTSDGPRFPLVIFLHGSGERGNSQINAANLDMILANGPPKLVKQGNWQPEYPMMVASPQCHDEWWDWQKVHNFIKYIRNTYQVDTTRIYLTGLSMGGYGTWDQLISYGSESYIAAAVPIAGSGNLVTDLAIKASKHPIWAFHGSEDKTVLPAYDLAMIPLVNAQNPKVKAKLTIYPGVGHDSWTKTYNGSGMGTEDSAYDPFDMDVFSWMLKYQKE